jgi:hypothetical protein
LQGGAWAEIVIIQPHRICRKKAFSLRNPLRPLRLGGESAPKNIYQLKDNRLLPYGWTGTGPLRPDKTPYIPEAYLRETHPVKVGDDAPRFPKTRMRLRYDDTSISILLDTGSTKVSTGPGVAATVTTKD